MSTVTSLTPKALLSEAEEILLIDGLNEQVRTDLWKGDWPNLFIHAIDARDRAKRIGYRKGLGAAHLNLGQLYRVHSEPDKAEPEFIEASRIFAELDDQVGLGAVLHQLGQHSLHKAEFERAIEYVLQAREIWLRLGEENRLATSYLTIGTIYCALEQYDSAQEQFDTSLAIYKRREDEVNYARVLSNMARVAQAKDDHEKALAIQLEAIEIFDRHDQSISIASTYLNLGSTYCRLKQYDQSIAVLTTALELADKKEYRRAQFIGRLYLAETYIEINDAISARRSFDDAEQFIGAGDLGDILPFHADIHAKLCACEGDHKLAYELQQKSIEVRLKLMSAQTQQAVATKSAHFNFEQTLKKKEVLRKQNAELIELNNQKDELLRIVSHDMRSPLGFIIGMGNLLKTEPDENKEAIAEVGELIEETAQRLLVLVNNLLNAARLEEGAHVLEKQATNVGQMLKETEKLFRPLAKNKNIEIKFDYALADGVVNVDEPKLQQVISNILSNAVKFTPRGGRVDVTARRDQGMLTFLIRDSGIGMNEELIKELFVKFSPTRRAGTEGEKGIGLGMTIIKQFVELHHGSVNIHSTEGEGTSVAVTVPDL